MANNTTFILGDEGGWNYCQENTLWRASSQIINMYYIYIKQNLIGEIYKYNTY